MIPADCSVSVSFLTLLIVVFGEYRIGLVLYIVGVEDMEKFVFLVGARDPSVETKCRLGSLVPI